MNYIRWIGEIGSEDIALVGGKGANLGKMARAGFPVPPGFCVIVPAYRQVIEETGLYPIIQGKLAEMDFGDPANVEESMAYIRERFSQQPVPTYIAKDILESYQRLGRMLGKGDLSKVSVTVRSSAVAEDFPSASFAEPQDSYLNVRGEKSLLENIRQCWASLWSAPAFGLRQKLGLDQLKISGSVLVQAMIEPEISGKMFTISKEPKIVYNANGNLLKPKRAEDNGANLQLSVRQRADLLTLAEKIEKHYGEPLEIEWGFAQDHCYIMAARPAMST